MNRRGFITGMTSLIVSPSIVRASSLDFVPRARLPVRLSLIDQAAVQEAIDEQRQRLIALLVNPSAILEPLPFKSADDTPGRLRPLIPKLPDASWRKL